MILRRKKRTLTAEDIHTELDRICKGAPKMDTLIRQEFIGFLPNQTQSANVPDNLPGHIPCPAQLMGHLLRVNAPGRLVVQLGEDDLQPTGATEYGLQFFLYGEDSTLEFGHSVQKIWIIFNYCCCHD